MSSSAQALRIFLVCCTLFVGSNTRPYLDYGEQSPFQDVHPVQPNLNHPEYPYLQANPHPFPYPYIPSITYDQGRLYPYKNPDHILQNPGGPPVNHAQTYRDIFQHHLINNNYEAPFIFGDKQHYGCPYEQNICQFLGYTGYPQPPLHPPNTVFCDYGMLPPAYEEEEIEKVKSTSENSLENTDVAMPFFTDFTEAEEKTEITTKLPKMFEKMTVAHLYSTEKLPDYEWVILKNSETTSTEPSTSMELTTPSKMQTKFTVLSTERTTSIKPRISTEEFTTSETLPKFTVVSMEQTTEPTERTTETTIKGQEFPKDSYSQTTEPVVKHLKSTGPVATGLFGNSDPTTTTEVVGKETTPETAEEYFEYLSIEAS